MSTDTQFLIEDNMMGWIIESNHLVDAMLREADRGEIINIMQRRYDAAYQTVLALRQHSDALHSQMAGMKIQLAQKESELDEIERDRRNAEYAAGIRDNNGNLVQIVSTGWQCAEHGREIWDYQLIGEPAKGYLAVYYDGMPNCWSWYGAGERYPSLPLMLASLAAGGHIVPVEAAKQGGNQ